MHYTVLSIGSQNRNIKLALGQCLAKQTISYWLTLSYFVINLVDGDPGAPYHGDWPPDSHNTRNTLPILPQVHP